MLQPHNQQGRILYNAKEQSNKKQKNNKKTKKIKEKNSDANRCELVACITHTWMALYARDYYRHVFHFDHKCFIGPSYGHSSTPHNEQWGWQRQSFKSCWCGSNMAQQECECIHVEALVVCLHTSIIVPRSTPVSCTVEPIGSSYNASGSSMGRVLYKPICHTNR